MDTAQRRTMRLEIRDRQAYLKDEPYLDFTGPSIATKARELFSGLSRDAEKIKAVCDYAATTPHSFEIASKHVSKTAAEVMEYGEGVCYAKAMLAAALLRRAGVPTGYVAQRLRMGDALDGPFFLHALNAAYLPPPYNAWALFDCGGNTISPRARFDPQAPLDAVLAFAVRPECGETTYPVIHANLPRPMLDALHRAATGKELFDNLPDAL